MDLFTKGYVVEEWREEGEPGFRYTSINADEGEMPSRMLDDKTGRDDRVSDRSE